MITSRQVRIVSALSIVLHISSSLAIAPIAAAQQIPQEFGAAGTPYADPAYCAALPDLIKSYEQKVLPQQAGMLQQQEARLREAQAGRAEAEREFNHALMKAVIDLGNEQITTARALRERVEAMKNLTRAQRYGWLTRIKDIEDSGKLLRVFTARHEYELLLRKNEDNLVNFMKLADDSGAADMALKRLANLLAPGIGGLVVNGIKVGLDVVYAGLKGHFTAQEATQWRENVDKLRTAHNAIKDRVDGYRQDLTGGLCGPKVAQQVENSPKPIPPPPAASGGAGAAAAAPKKGGGGGTTALVVLGSLAAVGGLIAVKGPGGGGGGDSCPTRSQCCGGGGAGGGCGVPAQCSCPASTRDLGICQAGRSCTLVGIRPGDRQCDGC